MADGQAGWGSTSGFTTCGSRDIRRFSRMLFIQVSIACVNSTCTTSWIRVLTCGTLPKTAFNHFAESLSKNRPYCGNMYYINYRYIAIVTHSHTNSVNWSKQYAPGSASHTTGPHTDTPPHHTQRAEDGHVLNFRSSRRRCMRGNYLYPLFVEAVGEGGPG